MIICIAAMDECRHIGYKNELPWFLPEDLSLFKQQTLGHTVVMGRKTYESIGRLLPKRKNVIVSRQALKKDLDAVWVSDLGKYLEEVRYSDELIYIIGGAQIYSQALPFTDYLIISHVEGEYPGDTFFPVIDPEMFECIEEISHAGFIRRLYARKGVGHEFSLTA